MERRVQNFRKFGEKVAAATPSFVIYAMTTPNPSPFSFYSTNKVFFRPLFICTWSSIDLEFHRSKHNMSLWIYLFNLFGLYRDAWDGSMFSYCHLSSPSFVDTNLLFILIMELIRQIRKMCIFGHLDIGRIRISKVIPHMPLGSNILIIKTSPISFLSLSLGDFINARMITKFRGL